MFPFQGLHIGTSHGASINELLLIIEDLVKLLKKIEDRWVDIESGVASSSVDILKAQKEYTGACGRPRYIIKLEQLIFLREIRFTWSAIAVMFGVSRRTMYNVRSKFGLIDNEFGGFSDITDEHLKSVILDIQQEMPHVGQSMLRGLLNARGIHVSVVRLRDCLSEMDPVSGALRWASPIKRRVYSVPHPNALWHVDGNHKLIR